jgi:metallo-beta-lactamase family protein
LKHHIEDPRTTILFVGYQAENTLGRKILDGQEIVKILGDEYHVRARIKRITGYSGHGDHNDLVGFAHNMLSKPRQTFIVHAEMEAAEKLQNGLERIGLKDVAIPDRGDRVDIN